MLRRLALQSSSSVPVTATSLWMMTVPEHLSTKMPCDISNTKGIHWNQNWPQRVLNVHSRDGSWSGGLTRSTWSLQASRTLWNVPVNMWSLQGLEPCNFTRWSLCPYLLVLDSKCPICTYWIYQAVYLYRWFQLLSNDILFSHFWQLCSNLLMVFYHYSQSAILNWGPLGPIVICYCPCILCILSKIRKCGFKGVDTGHFLFCITSRTTKFTWSVVVPIGEMVLVDINLFMEDFDLGLSAFFQDHHIHSKSHLYFPFRSSWQIGFEGRMRAF